MTNPCRFFFNVTYSNYSHPSFASGDAASAEAPKDSTLVVARPHTDTLIQLTNKIDTGWWFQPLWKILVKMGIFPK